MPSIKYANGFTLREPGKIFKFQIRRKEVINVFKQLFRIGLLHGLCRNTPPRLVCLVGVLSDHVRTCLVYVWKNRRKAVAIMKAFLQFVKLLCEVIQKIHSLLFCYQTATCVRVAG